MGQGKSSDDAAAAAMGSLLGLLLVVAAILSILGICLGLGVLYGAVCSVVNFCQAAGRELGKRTGRTEEHAVVGYFHWRGDWFDNYKAVCAETWKLNLAKIPRPIILETVEFWWAVSAFRLAQAVGLVVATGVVLPVLFVGMGMVFLPIWLAYSLVSAAIRGGSWMVDKIYGLFNLCRYCHRKVPLPKYRCPRCGTEHVHLIPTAKFGPFHRTCECGERLPTMRMLGRSKLSPECPHCGRAMDDGKFAPVCVAFVGGPSVGKSQMMMDSVVAIKERVGKKLGMSVAVPAEDAGKVGTLERDYRAGVTPGATRDAEIEAICLEARKKGQTFPTRLYLYDPPGESFRSAGKVLRHKYYEHLRAVVFVVDPSAMPEVMGAYEDKGVVFGIPQKGAQSPEESFQRWLIAMDQEYPGRVKDSVCALVVGKADEASMKSVTGLGAGEGNSACRTFLAKHGGGNLLSALETNFRDVRAFSVGAVGNGGGGKAFSPVGLDAMLEWVLKEA